MGIFGEKEEVDSPADFQPEAMQTSPYLTGPVSLLIGPKKARYTVPRAFLSESPQWSRLDNLKSNSWDCDLRINLPEVNEDVGHTLVHYLYRGTFQKLQSSEDDDLTAELKKNVHLHGIAAKYGLAGLKELALEKIQNKEGLGDIFDILETIKEASKTLLKEDDLELKPYVQRELKAAFESDGTLFGKERFIELFGEAKQFDRILMRIVAEIYSEKIAHISKNTLAVIDESPLSLLDEEPTSVIYEEPPGCGELDEYEKPSVCEQPVTCEDLVVSELDLSEGYPDQRRVPTLEKELSEKKEETTPKWSPWDHPRHSGQDLSGGHPPVYPQGASEDDFPTSVIGESAFCGEPPPPCDETPAPVQWSFGGSFTSSNIAGFGNQPFTWGEAASRAEAVTCEEVAALVEVVPCEEAAAPVEPVICEAAAPPTEAIPPDKSASHKKNKKVKKAKGVKSKSSHDPENKATPFADTVAETAAETVPFAEKAPCTEVVVPSAAVSPYAEPDPVTEAVPYIEAVFQENMPSKKKLKKAKAKATKCWVNKAPLGDGKKIESQNAKETMELLDLVPGSSTSGEPVHEASSPTGESRTEYGIELVQHPDESSICASRATHLLVDDEWKKCPKCRALVHHLSLEFARVGG